MEDPRTRFTRTVGDYERHRPGYPDAALDWLVETTGVRPPADVADLGSGTGISTRWLAARGFDVVGVEPNDAMRARATARGGAQFVRGESTATGLPPQSVDLVVGCQAWHWFDLGEALAECRRILRPGGWCAALWNLRDEGPFSRAYDAVIARHSAEVGQVPTGHETIPLLRARPEVRGAVEADFPHAQALDLEGVLGRAASSSYVAHGVEDRAGMEAALRDAFAAHARDGLVRMTYVTRVLAFRVGDRG